MTLIHGNALIFVWGNLGLKPDEFTRGNVSDLDPIPCSFLFQNHAHSGKFLILISDFGEIQF